MRASDSPHHPPPAEPGGPTVGPFVCLDQAWQVAGGGADLHAMLEHLYRPLLAELPAGTRLHDLTLTRDDDGLTTVLVGAEEMATARTPAGILGKVIWATNRLVIEGATERLVLHASAAADIDGRVALLPAPMESGKTTLVTGLLDRGLHYLTDEAAAVGDDLSVEGYAKPLSIDPGSWEVLAHHRPDLPDGLADLMHGQWQVPPHTFTTVVPSGRLAVVVFPTYAVDEPTTLTRLSPIDALDLARASTFGTADQPHPVWKIRRLAAMVGSVPCFALRSGDLDAACAAVLGALAEAP